MQLNIITRCQRSTAAPLGPIPSLPAGVIGTGATPWGPRWGVPRRASCEGRKGSLPSSQIFWIGTVESGYQGRTTAE